MATSAELVEAYRGVSADIASMAADDMAAFIESLDLTDVEKAREALIVFTDSLVQTYGRAEAMTAAKFYDDLRGISTGATGRFRATLADGATRDQIVGTVRWAVGQDNPGMALSGSVQRLLAQTGRDTIAGNARRDPSYATWARVPSGFHVCGFCKSLASRGAVYGSKDAARFDKGGDRYHDRCHCVPTPMWRGDKYPKGFDPKEYERQYEAAQKELGGNASLSEVAAKLDEGRVRNDPLAL